MPADAAAPDRLFDLLGAPERSGALCISQVGARPDIRAAFLQLPVSLFLRWTTDMTLALMILAWLLVPVLLWLGFRRLSFRYAVPLTVAAIAAGFALSGLWLGQGSFAANQSASDIAMTMGHARQFYRLALSHVVLGAITFFIAWLATDRAIRLSALAVWILHLASLFPTLQSRIVQDPVTFAGMQVQSAYALSNLFSLLSGSLAFIGIALLGRLLLTALNVTLSNRRSDAP